MVSQTHNDCNKKLKLSLIRTDGGTQMRAKIQEDVYMDYRDKWLAGVKFDPVDVFHDGVTYWLGDGFHRFYGAREAKLDMIPANVRKGTQRDAILFASGANATHGLRRSNADKRRAVETLLNDEEWVKWSDNKIAEQTGVHQTTVSAIRKELMDSINSPAAQAASQPRVGRDGKTYPSPKSSGKTTHTGATAASPGNGEHTEAPGDSSKGKAKETAETLVDAMFKSHVGPIARDLLNIAEANGGEGEQFRLADAGLNQFITALKEMRKGDSPGDPCPVCAGRKWVEGKFGLQCKKCSHVCGECVGDPDEDRIKTQRSKTVKTCEALLRAFDDLNHICPNGNHPEAIRLTKAALKLGREWKI